MQAVEVKKEGLKREYKVTVPATELAQMSKTRLAEVGKTVRVPGFRPGKTPQNILEQRYGEAVMGEVVEKAVNDGTTNALRDNKVRPASQPAVNIDSFAKGKDLEFTVSIEVLPDFTVMDVKSIKLERPVAKVSDESIEDALSRIAKNNRQTKKVETPRAAKNGDIVVIDYSGKLEDGTTKPGMSSVGYHLELGSNSFIAGFEDQLAGAKPGDEVTVNVTFPADYGAADLAGKKAQFAVKLHEIREPEAPEINDDFAKTLGIEDLNALKKAVRDQMESEYVQYSRQKVKRALFDLLDESHDFPLPEGMVEAEYKVCLDQIEQEKKYKGEGEPLNDDETSELKDIAARRVRLGLILSEVGQANNIQVSDQDLHRAVMDQARRFPGQEAQVFEMFRKNQQMVDSLRAPIFEDKVVDFILELAEIKDKEVALDELTRDDDADEGDAKTEKKKPAKKAKK
ncbi:MAG: trigger factor [Rhodospirillales bacterium]|nr:trigger factor [Alphaproteobacteria bacterium]MCB9987315.1 trigger factor [Rhodospirillales bacterium]USO07829.1 MAG: trigger factor [Rhodospirillales bacterium]